MIPLITVRLTAEEWEHVLDLAARLLGDSVAEDPIIMAIADQLAAETGE